MALPAQLQEKKRALEAAAAEEAASRAEEQKLASVTPPVAAVEGGSTAFDEGQFVVTPITAAQETAPLLAEPESHWKDLATLHEKHWQTLQGMNQKLEKDNTSLKEELDSLKTAVQELKNPAAKSMTPASDPQDDLTEEELATYKETFPVIEKVSKRQAKQLINSVVEPLLKKIQDLESNQTSVVKDLKTTNSTTFYNVVSSTVKDFSAIVADPKFKEYLGQRVPFADYTIGQALEANIEHRNLDRVVEIYSGFSKGNVVKPSISSMMSPNLGSSGATTIKQPPMLKMSARKQANEDFRRGRIDKATMDNISNLYAKAEKENRIDFNS